MAYSSVERPLFAEDTPEHMGSEGLPSEAQLILLCLDYLRDLRRSYSKEDLLDAEGIDADYLSVSIYALSRCFLKPPELTNKMGSDNMMDRNKANMLTPGLFPVQDPVSSKNYISIPNLSTINKEILYSENPAVLDNNNNNNNNTAECNKNQDPNSWYQYDNTHISNGHRFYPLEGLATGTPFSLGEITVAGLAGLGARCRGEVDKEIKESQLFEQFASAVRAKGFFRNPDTETPRNNPEEERARVIRAREVEEERLQKVVDKFRYKLAAKAQQQLDDGQDEGPPLLYDTLVMTAGERLEQRRQAHMEAAQRKRNGGGGGAAPPNSPPEEELGDKPRLSIVTSLATKFFTVDTPTASESPTPRQRRSGRPLKDVTQEASPLDTPHVSSSVEYSSPLQDGVSPLQDDNLDIEEAERLKSAGNGHMQRKEFAKAAKAYTQALLLSPNGPNTHVYYSNRAAALLSMKKMEEAVVDSEKSLALKPDYGKGHSRLGLAHFLLGNYQEAVQSYTLGLKYDPDNKSTKNYLEKAAKRLAAQEKAAQDNGGSPSAATSSPPTCAKEEMDDQMKMDGRSELMNQREATRRKKESDKIKKEAEKLKLLGNTQMANRDHQAALEAYSAALKLCPDGPNSHVYFSNRAAALCYLERYDEAEKDSEMSLALVPTYGKAHARLGLSRFFMGDYAGAIDAYTAALTYDPDNTASKSYLAKAKARLARQHEKLAASESLQESV